jgi:hypothetical protein
MHSAGAITIRWARSAECDELTGHLRILVFWKFDNDKNSATMADKVDGRWSVAIPRGTRLKGCCVLPGAESLVDVSVLLLRRYGLGDRFRRPGPKALDQPR